MRCSRYSNNETSLECTLVLLTRHAARFKHTATGYMKGLLQHWTVSIMNHAAASPFMDLARNLKPDLFYAGRRWNQQGISGSQVWLCSNSFRLYQGRLSACPMSVHYSHKQRQLIYAGGYCLSSLVRNLKWQANDHNIVCILLLPFS